MNAKERTQEQISALLDGEVADSQIEIALAALHTPEGLAAWEAYHRVGDALRSDDMAFSMSADFTARLTARLEREPAIVAPVSATARKAQLGRQASGPHALPRSVFKRFAMPGMAAAAVVTAVFVTTPHLLVTQQEVVANAHSPIIMVANTDATSGDTQSSTSAAVAAPVDQDTVVLRDPRIDEYLMAHQRFSPFLGSAQYARTATFAAESGK